MRPNKTDRNDAAALAQIVRTGWFKQVRIKSRTSYEIRSLLAAREVLVRVRVKLENEIRACILVSPVIFPAGCFILPVVLLAAPFIRSLSMFRAVPREGLPGSEQRLIAMAAR
jgi:hypothetical protein